MHSLIESLNLWGERFLSFAWPMLWQSSVLIAFLFVLDLMIRRRARATVRYALWMLVLIKLVLPTSLSLPTSPGYWVQAPAVFDAALAIETPRASARPAPEPATIVDSSPSQAEALPVQERAESPLQPAAAAEAFSLSSTPQLRWPAFIGLTWLFGVVAISLLVVFRGRLAWRLVADASGAPDEVQSLVGECARRLGVRSRIAAKFTDALATPVVCGFFRPVILLPRTLAGRLAPDQLQAVLLHELAHVRRGDLWVSHLQTALQILHFYNPLLWLANARIRRVREEAVDEMVLAALADAADVYPETLLTVAKLSPRQSSLAFGLIGILESKSSLSQRIRLMLLRPWPKTARVGFKGILVLILLAVTLLPMSCAKKQMATTTSLKATQAPQVRLEVKFVELPVEAVTQLVPPDSRARGSFSSSTSLWITVLSPEQARLHLLTLQTASDIVLHSTPGVTVSNGQQAHIELTNFVHLFAPPIVVDVPAGDMQFVSPPSATLPMGHAVDVTPLASADGHSLELTLLPALIEILGYADSTISDFGTNNSVRMTARLPLPRIRVRQMATRASILNGQTVVLGGLPVQYTTDKVPVLGDLPTIGQHGRTVLIFVTAKVVGAADPAQSEAAPPMTNGTTAHESATLEEMLDDLQSKKLFTAVVDFADSNSAVQFHTSPGIGLAFANGTGLEREPALRIDERGRYLLGERELNFDELTRAIADTLPNSSSNIYVRVAHNAPVSAVARFARACSELGVVAAIIRDSAPKVAATNLMELYTKFFKVGTNTFKDWRPERSDFGGGFGNRGFQARDSDTNQLARAARRAFSSAGLELQPPKVVFFGDRSGVLMVHATLEELAKVEKVLQELETTPPLDLPAALRPARIDSQGRYWLGTNALSLDDLRKAISVTQTNSGKTLFVSIANDAPGRHVSEFAKLCASMGIVAVFIHDSATIVAATNAPLLYTKFFKVDPNTFYQRLGGDGSQGGGFLGGGTGGGFGSGSFVTAEKVREFFAAMGVDLTPPKAIFFNDRAGYLMVHATLEEMEIIEDALHVVNASPPQVKIEVKFVEIKMADARALGVAWQSGNLILSTTNILGSPPRSNTSALASPTGILADSQFRATMQALEKRDGTDIVSVPAVITLSRRAARIEVTDATNIVVQGQTQTIQLGPSLEVLAEVLPDKSEIELTVSADVVEFFGYHDPGPGEDRKMLRFRDGDWAEETGPTTGLIPRIGVRKLKATARVWDGQTLVLANPVGVNGNPAEQPGYKQLVVFVKPTIIDPSGNPLHTDADMPFRTNSIPPQKAAAPPR